MNKKLAALTLLAAASGCRMCSDCCDYTAPVAGGPPLGTARSGSVLGGGFVPPPIETPAIETMPVAAAQPPITPLPAQMVR
jgi:hypothetical protein